MKLSLFVLSLLTLASTANATPSVGDAVSFQGTWDGQAVWQYLSFTAYNPSTQQFTKTTTTKIGAAAPATQQDMVNYNDAASDAALQYIVSNCAAYNGVSEYASVPAGNFLTCKMPLQQGGFVWVGQVPFAVVRIETPVQGKMLVALLTGVTRGQ